MSVQPGEVAPRRSAERFMIESGEEIPEALFQFLRPSVPPYPLSLILKDCSEFMAMIREPGKTVFRFSNISYMMTQGHHLAHISGDVNKLRWELNNSWLNLDRAGPLWPKFDKMIGQFAVGDSLKLLHRFIAEGQPRLLAPATPASLSTPEANPDAHSSMKYEFYFRRLLLRYLHYPGLLTFKEDGGYDDTRVTGLIFLYGVSRLLLELEHHLMTTVDGDSYPPKTDHHGEEPDFFRLKSIHKAKDAILHALKEISLIPYNSPRGMSAVEANRMNPIEKFEYNMKYDDLAVLQQMSNKYDSLIAMDDGTTPDNGAPGNFRKEERLFVDLLTRENEFEFKLAKEHIEDKLITKQIVLFDEKDMVKKGKHSAWNLARLAVTPIFEGAEKLMGSMLDHLSLFNIQRRNFRLMRDWNGRRPWSQIYQYYDTSQAETEWLKEAISRFDSIMEFSRHGPDDGYPPSSFKVIGKKLFGFKPINFSDYPEGPADCEICKTEFKSSNTFEGTVMRLHCPDSDHRFHLKCIFDYWDEPGRYLHSCPKCRYEPGLNFVHMGLNPEPADVTFVHNVYSFAPHPKYHDPEKRRKRYDLPREPAPGVASGYWDTEVELASPLMPAAASSSMSPQWGDIDIYHEGAGHLVRHDDRDVWHRWIREESDNWLARDWLRVADAQEAANGRWVTQGTRYTTYQEEAYLRFRRRTRDKEKRRDVRRSRTGLSSLK